MTSVSTLGSSQIQTEVAAYEKQLEVPITALQTQETTDKAEISAWGAIQGKISSLSSALSGIADVSTLNNRSATSSQTSVASATATSDASTGAYDLTGVKLAKAQSLYSALQGSSNAQLSGGAGSLTIALQNGKSETLNFASGSLTLSKIAAAVNKQAGGVQASVISTSTGARLILQSSATGSSQAFSVSGTGALSRFAYSAASAGSETLTQSAQDATLSLNGVPLTSSSNTIASAISGVTFKLTGSGSTLINISSSPSTLSTALSKVATDLNAALSSIATETKYVASGSASSASASGAATSGPLLGNFTAANLSNQLLSAVSGAAASGISAATLGFSVSSTGAVSFDTTSFASAYAKNPTAVQTLVGQIYSSLSTVTKSAIGSGSSTSTTSTSSTSGGGGAIGTAITGLQSTNTSLAAQVTQMTKIDTKQIDELLTEYSAAESAATSASITQSYLSVFLGSSSSSG